MSQRIVSLAVSAAVAMLALGCSPRQPSQPAVNRDGSVTAMPDRVAFSDLVPLAAYLQQQGMMVPESVNLSGYYLERTPFDRINIETQAGQIMPAGFFVGVAMASCPKNSPRICHRIRMTEFTDEAAAATVRGIASFYQVPEERVRASDRLPTPREIYVWVMGHEVGHHEEGMADDYNVYDEALADAYGVEDFFCPTVNEFRCSRMRHFVADRRARSVLTTGVTDLLELGPSRFIGDGAPSVHSTYFSLMEQQAGREMPSLERHTAVFRALNLYWYDYILTLDQSRGRWQPGEDYDSAHLGHAVTERTYAMLRFVEEPYNPRYHGANRALYDDTRLLARGFVDSALRLKTPDERRIMRAMARTLVPDVQPFYDNLYPEPAPVAASTLQSGLRGPQTP